MVDPSYLAVRSDLDLRFAKRKKAGISLCRGHGSIKSSISIGRVSRFAVRRRAIKFPTFSRKMHTIKTNRKSSLSKI